MDSNGHIGSEEGPCHLASTVPAVKDTPPPAAVSMPSFTTPSIPSIIPPPPGALSAALTASSLANLTESSTAFA